MSQLFFFNCFHYFVIFRKLPRMWR